MVTHQPSLPLVHTVPEKPLSSCACHPRGMKSLFFLEHPHSHPPGLARTPGQMWKMRLRPQEANLSISSFFLHSFSLYFPQCLLPSSFLSQIIFNLSEGMSGVRERILEEVWPRRMFQRVGLVRSQIVKNRQMACSRAQGSAGLPACERTLRRQSSPSQVTSLVTESGDTRPHSFSCFPL